jgi:hypothetical protein
MEFTVKQLNALKQEKGITRIVEFAPDNSLVVVCKDHLKRLIRFNDDGSIIWVDSYSRLN